MKSKLSDRRVRHARHGAAIVIAVHLALLGLLFGPPGASADGTQANVASYFSACTADVYLASRQIGNEAQRFEAMPDPKPAGQWDSQIDSPSEQLVDTDLIVSIVAPTSKKNDYGLKAAMAAADANLTVNHPPRERKMYEAPTLNAAAGSAREGKFAAIAGLVLFVALLGCFAMHRIIVVRSQSSRGRDRRVRVRRSVTGSQRQSFGSAYQVV
jgi:hypothetical protein